VGQTTHSQAGEERLAVGLVRGIHGLRGAVRVEILTDNPSRFDVGQTVYREGSDEPLTIASAHRDGPGLLVRFEQVTTREVAVEKLRDAYLVADPEPLPEDTFYWHDILGCAVVSTTGEDLGIVTDIFRVGESEVYERSTRSAARGARFSFRQWVTSSRSWRPPRNASLSIPTPSV
jgi:16S rRNA processing protein RimM